ncbi:MAG: extracellular solute-binding protein [Clostridia bacterium]|nr:extracellular solute-binding protein [Clostridia bacterium]
MKKVLAIVLALVMVFGLAACGNGGGNTTPQNNTADDKPLAGTYKIKVWAAENNQDLTKKQIDDFNKTNDMGIVIEATVEPVSEADAGTNMITDIEAGPDIYWFAQDQFARLVNAGALDKLGTGASKTVAEANDPGVVAAGSINGQLWAYPATSDNGYFMYYDKSVVPEADVKSLEKIIADCEAAKKYFAFEAQTSAWYLASWFFGTGCKSEWEMDNDGKYTGVKDDFNSANGLIAAKGMYKLVSSPFHLSSSKGAEFESGAAVVVTGMWDYDVVQKILGDNMGVAELPSFEVDGKQYHLGSFNGCKLVGVKPQTDPKKGAALHQLAQYLTDYDRQMERFNTLSWGPANLKAQSDDKVKANPGLATLFAQNAYSQPQGQIHGSWWDIGKVIADDVKASGGTEEGLKKALQNYQDKIDALFAMSEEEKNAWTVIGAVAGSNWDKDFEMKKEGENVWKSVDKFDLKAGDEFKCRQGKNWDVSIGNGGDNYKVEADGTYTIVLTLSGDSGTITLEK